MLGKLKDVCGIHIEGIKQRLVAEALKLFYEIREVPGMKKKPSTSELLDWLKLLMVEDIGPEILRERDPKKLIPPLHGALIKNEQDAPVRAAGVHGAARGALKLTANYSASFVTAARAALRVRAASRWRANHCFARSPGCAPQ